MRWLGRYRWIDFIITKMKYGGQGVNVMMMTKSPPLHDNDVHFSIVFDSEKNLWRKSLSLEEEEEGYRRS